MTLMVYFYFAVLLFVAPNRLLVFGLEYGSAEEAEEAEGRGGGPGGSQSKFESEGGEHLVAMHSTVTLPCLVSDLGVNVVTWYKVTNQDDSNNPNNERSGLDQLFVGRIKMTQDDRYHLIDNGNENDFSFRIFDVSGLDSGLYECHISSLPTIRRHKLTVKMPATAMIIPNTNPYILEPGQSMSLDCYSGGYPDPEVVWSRQFAALPDGRALVKSRGSSQLFYDNVNVSHSGTYLCRADNQVGEPTTAKIYVEVYSKNQTSDAPVVETNRNFVPVAEGDTIVLSCNYSAYPPSQVHWIFDRIAINSQNQQWKDRIAFGNMSAGHELTTTTLTITNVMQSDFGEYSCRVKNSFGTAEEHIDVQGKPGPPYLFTAAVHNDRIDLSWMLESATNVSGFKLFYRLRDGDFSSEIDIPAQNGRRVQNNEWAANYTWRLDEDGLLKPDTDYQFGIQGVNDYGDGSLPRPLLNIRTLPKLEIDESEKEKVEDNEDAKEVGEHENVEDNDDAKVLDESEKDKVEDKEVPTVAEEIDIDSLEKNSKSTAKLCVKYCTALCTVMAETVATCP